MSKNTKTYILLGIVLVIWGIIGFRIVSAVSSEPEIENAPRRITFKQIELTPQDTFLIKADYRDPFLGTLAQKKEKKKPQNLVKKQSFDMDVRYTGSMVNHSSGKRIYFVSINGQQHLMERGKNAMGIAIVSGNEERITVRYKGMVKRIPLQS